MIWYYKYKPTILADICCNKSVVKNLMDMINKKNFTHFILSGETGSGKRTLIKAFLNEISATDQNVMWVNHLSYKTIESKEKLNSFINSKTDAYQKWIIIENLHKMSIQFLNVLYYLLRKNNIIICILGDNSIDLSSWTIKFKLNSPSYSELIEISKNILKQEGLKYDEQIIDKFINTSQYKLYTFLYFLEVYYKINKDISIFSKTPLNYELLLFGNDLKLKLLELKRLELIGYSHLDIATELFQITSLNIDEKLIEFAIEVGDGIDHLNKFEHDNYYLYSTIVRLHKINKKFNIPKDYLNI
tara:strand:- start:1365 stop:2270 length:906 start_codon:yes stop_codon:yes gene_type:complete